MSKRSKRKRRPGRRVYYEKRWSSAMVHNRTKAERTRENIGRGRLTSEANLIARERRENHTNDIVINTLKMNRNGDNAGRDQALNQLQHLVRLDQMDRHVVVHQGLRSVLILLFETKARRVWFVERNLLTGKLRRSISYGSISQALSYHQTQTITFV